MRIKKPHVANAADVKISREADLYKMYRPGDRKMALARARATGIPGVEDEPLELREPMCQTSESVRRELG